MHQAGLHRAEPDGTLLVSGAAESCCVEGQRCRHRVRLLTGFSRLLTICWARRLPTDRSIRGRPCCSFQQCGCVSLPVQRGNDAFSGQAPLDNFMWLGASASGWAILILLGLGPTIGGFGLYLVSLGYLPATVANLIGALEPAFTAVWAYLLFLERLTQYNWSQRDPADERCAASARGETRDCNGGSAAMRSTSCRPEAMEEVARKHPQPNGPVPPRRVIRGRFRALRLTATCSFAC